MMLPFSKKFLTAIAAGEAAIRINTDEMEDAIRAIVDLAKGKDKDKEKTKGKDPSRGWSVRVWDHSAGVELYTDQPPSVKAGMGLPPTASSVTSGNSINDMLEDTSEGPASFLGTLVDFLDTRPAFDVQGDIVPQILVFKNFHLAFDEDRGTVSSTIQHLVNDKMENHAHFDEILKSKLRSLGMDSDVDTGRFIVGLMPQEARLPPEVRPLFKIITHELPEKTELRAILDPLVADNVSAAIRAGFIDEQRDRACYYALGLTRLQADGVFAAAIAQFGKYEDFGKKLMHFVWTEKSRILNDEGLVTLHQGKETFDDVVGHEGLKQLLRDLMKPDPDDPGNPDLRSRGVALVGPPRTGKSMTVKACGNEADRPLLFCDVGALMGGIIGETEAKTRKFFQIIRVHAPCIAFIDEVEKVMPSARGYDGDGGVGRRMAGTFMTNMQDIVEDVFWVFAANDTANLHEAFLADDRVDCVVYVGMPDAAQLAAGWKLYIKKFFPAEIAGEPYERAMKTTVKGACDEYLATAKAKPNDPAWIEQFTAAVMCYEDREKALAKIAEMSSDGVKLAEAVRANLIDDSSWTIARVKSCCRLARKRCYTLTLAAKMMPRRQQKLQKVISRLEGWAEEEAIDARTGLAYVRAAKVDEAGEPKVRSGSRRRRQLSSD